MLYFFSCIHYNVFLPEMFFSASLFTLLCIYLYSVLSKKVNQHISLISTIKSSFILTIYNDITAVRTFLGLLLYILLLCLDLLVLTLNKFNSFFTEKAYIFLYFDSLCITYNSLIYKIVLASMMFLYLAICLTLRKNFFLNVEHYFLICLVFLGGLILFSSNNFLVVFLAIELVSIPMYILAGSYTFSNFSTEAGLKYLIIGAVSSAFLMLGFSYLYGGLGVSSFSDLSLITNYVLWDNNLSGSLFKRFLSDVLSDFLLFDFSRLIEFIALLDAEFKITFGVFFIFIALFLKLGVAPFHFWMPDVYVGAPANVTLFFMTVQKFILWVFFFEIYACYLPEVISTSFYFLFYFIIFMNIVFGIFPALYQDKFKKLLIYSSIGINSYLLLSVMQGIASYFLLFICVYIFNVFGLFSIFFNFKVSTDSFLNKFSLYRNLYWSAPITSFFFVMFLLSVAGLPPTVGFISKFVIYLTTFNIHFVLIISILIASTAMAFYYFRLIRFMFIADNKNYNLPISWVFILTESKVKLIINYFINYSGLLLILLLVYYRSILFYLDFIFNSSITLVDVSWFSIF